MAIPNNPNEQQYWFDGLPYEGMYTGYNSNSQKYWFNGLPSDFLQPIGTSPKGASVQDTAFIKRIKMIGY